MAALGVFLIRISRQFYALNLDYKEYVSKTKNASKVSGNMWKFKPTNFKSLIYI